MVTGLPCPIEYSSAASAIIASAGVVSRGAFRAGVGNMAAALRAWGLSEGRILGIAAHPSVDYLYALAASFRLGVIVCPINPRWPFKTIQTALAGVGCAHLIVPSEIETETFSTRCFSGLTASASALDMPAMIDDAQLGALVFTSGSSSAPKAALLSYGNIYHNALASNENIALGPGDRWLLSLPLYHVSGLGVLFRCMLSGAAVVLPALAEPVEEAIMRCGVTHVSLVPTQLYRLLGTDHGVQALSRLKAILLGGGAIPPALIRRAVELELPIHTSYGLTEMASQAATTRPGDPLEKLLTSGKPLASDTVVLAHDGEILVRGKTLFQGYLGTNGVERDLTPEGWFATRDIGRFDEDGYLIVEGRKDNMFISGGENIQPEEIERCLCRIDGVTDAVVTPLEDPEFGFTPVAFVQSDAPLNADAILEQLAEDLPRYKIPKRLFPWPSDVPCTDIKINRRAWALRARTLVDLKP